jgi:glycosyltransferase involved in cell wall biosynthesis
MHKTIDKKTDFVGRGITFIVIAKNEVNFISSCVDSIVKLTFLEKQIILVNSGSDDGTASIMQEYDKKYENIISINSYKKGPSAARNAGLRLAEKDFVFFVDGDVEIQSGFFDLAFAEFEENITTSAIAGKLAEKTYDTDCKICLKSIDDRYKRTARKYVKRFGGIFMVRMSVVKSVGDWDESLICHEDTDYAIRMSSFGKLTALPVKMGIHNTTFYEDRMSGMISNGYFKGLGLFVRKYLSRPCIVFNFVSGLRFLYPSYLILLTLLASVLVDVRCTYFLVLVLFADMLHAYTGNKSLKSRFLAHYLAPLQVVQGLFGFTKQ